MIVAPSSGFRAAHLVKVNAPIDGRDTPSPGGTPSRYRWGFPKDQAAPHVGGCIPWSDLVFRLLAFLLSEEPLMTNLLDL